SQKHARVLNFVFTPDWIYWSTDDYNPIHFLFRTPRLPSGGMDTDVESSEELHQFESGDVPTYATIHLPKINALVRVGRADIPSTSAPIELWDMETSTMHRLGMVQSVGGATAMVGFRCETIEFVPRGNEVAFGFSDSAFPLGSGYVNRIAALGNSSSSG